MARSIRIEFPRANPIVMACGNGKMESVGNVGNGFVRKGERCAKGHNSLQSGEFSVPRNEVEQILSPFTNFELREGLLPSTGQEGDRKQTGHRENLRKGWGIPKLGREAPRARKNHPAPAGILHAVPAGQSWFRNGHV